MSQRLTIFDDQIARKPERYLWAKQYIQTFWDNPWNVAEFNFNSDIQNFKVNLTDKERIVVSRTLSAISQVETGVKTFWSKLGDNLPAMRDLGCVMSNSETVHLFAYEKLIDVLGLEEIFEKNLKVPIIAGRVNYLRKHTHKFYSESKKQYIYALILFTLFVENVSLFSQFYIMNWFNRKKNIFKQINNQILYTKNEETLHFLIGAQIVNTIKKEFPELFDDELEAKIIKESKEAVEHEIKISEWLLDDYHGEDLEKETLAEFIKNRMNISLKQIGFKPLYEINPELKNKFWWFEEELAGTNFVDFFNQRSVDYSKNNKSFQEDDLF